MAMTRAGASRIAWGSAALVASVTATGLGLMLTNPTRTSVPATFVAYVTYLVFPVIGALIAARRPSNPIGWLLLAVGLMFAVGGFGQEIALRSLATGSPSIGLAVRIDALASGWWAPALGMIAVFVPLLFPDGHLASPRWRLVAWPAGVGMVMVAFGAPFATDALSGLKNAPANPFADPSAAPVTALLGGTGIGAVMLIAAVPITAVGLVLRFRRARGAVRDQLTWFVFGAVVLALSIIVGVILDASGHPDARANVIGTGVLAIPLATGIAMLRYRLYDVDVVIRKTVVAAVLVLVAVSVYAAAVGAFGLVAAGRETPGVMFVIALILGLAFRPIARFARRLADRLVYGKRATPYEVLTEFSERVSETYATDDVLPRMARILADGIGAEQAAVWLRVGDGLRPAATTGGDLPAAVPMTADALPTFPESDHAVEVRHQGDLLGALSVRMPASDPMNAAREQLIRDLAKQAGLVLRNVRLIEDLRDSRRRLVAAQDEERRRLERNIHDGAQQQLVALSVKHRLLAGLIGTDDERARVMAEQLLEDTNDALQNLRDLARGIYPPLLADKGLPDALAAQARKIAVPIEISTNGAGRYPQEVEAAVYFCALEALQNVTKYANASKATVRIEARDGQLTFVVEDDGDGFDPQADIQGTGLQGMSDRLEALGGSLQVDSHPGSGTTITGRVPARTEAPGG